VIPAQELIHLRRAQLTWIEPHLLQPPAEPRHQQQVRLS
jgi:hypothetical protein